MDELDDKKVKQSVKGLWVPNEVFGNDNLTYIDKFLFPIIQLLDGIHYL